MAVWRVVVVAAALVAAGPSGVQPLPPFPQVGEWNGYRGRATLDARSALRGHIAQPAVAWRYFAGAVDVLAALDPCATSGTMSLDPTQDPGRAAEADDPRWGLAPPMGDLGGQLAAVGASSTVVCADVLPEEPGLEKIEFESGFSLPTVNGQWQQAVGRCFAFRDGQWRQVWQTDPIDMLFLPMPLVGDFDGDGRLEVAILPFRELLVLDAATGKVDARCSFTEGRSYGFFGAYDLGGDGRTEFVVLSDFAKHVDVLGYRNGQLAVLWQRTIELDISNPQKILRVTRDPVADVDGDGAAEIMLNLFNGTGDERWHLLIVNGLTGAVKFDFPDEHFLDCADVNDDGIPELLTAPTAGQGIPAFGPCLVRSVKGGRPAILATVDDAGWHPWSPPQPAHVNTGATLGLRGVMHRNDGGRFRAVLRRRTSDGADELRIVEWSRGGLVCRATVTGPGVEAVGLDAGGALLLRCTTPPGVRPDLQVVNGDLRPLLVRPRAMPLATPVVIRSSDGSGPIIVVPGAEDLEQTVAFRPPRGNTAPEELWRVSGRSMGDNWPSVYSPVAADLRGDGRRQVILATAAPTGCARLAVMELDGSAVWTHDFATIPGTAPVWNTGGLVFWQVGRFTDPRRQDVLVTVRRSMMHSEETCLLSGSDGHEVWRRPRQVSNRGVGGTPFAIADFDGDGLDDACSLHPSILYILRGKTGEDIVAMDCTWDPVPAKPVYWGLPIAVDLPDSPAPGVFFGTARRSMTGLLRADGSLAWWDALDASPSALPALGDFDGTGDLEAIGAGYEDGLRCYSLADGRVKWRMPSPFGGAPTGCATADLDSDGRDEAVFASGATLYCIGASAGGPSLEWRLELPCAIGPPAIADVDETGAAAIVVIGRDGAVYCVR